MRDPAVYRVTVVACLVVLSTHLTFAQGPDTAFATSHLIVLQSTDPPQSPARPAHKFFDATNITLTVAESAALMADGVYTRRGLNRYPDWGYEADPLARPFVNAGWPGQIAGGALVVSADVALRYLLHRKGHHTLERLVPLALIVYGTMGAVHNARVLRDIERGR